MTATYLVTLTKRFTEDQVRELAEYANKKRDLGLEQWLGHLLDEAVMDLTSPEAWGDVDIEGSDEESDRFSTIALVRRECTEATLVNEVVKDTICWECYKETDRVTTQHCKHRK